MRTKRVLLGVAGFLAVAGIAMLAIGTPIAQAGSDLLGAGNPSSPGFFYGDAFEPLYHWWVWLFQVGHLSSPYVDPFSFGALVGGVPNQMGWPFAPLFGIFLPFGAPLAYNAVLILTYPLAGGATYLWLRSVGAHRAGAIAGGVLVAFFPSRVARLGSGHYVGWLVVLLPIALWMVERAARAESARARAWWSVGFGITLISIVQAGEFYFALFGALIAGSYAVFRLGRRIITDRALWVIVGGLALAFVAALLMRWWFITGSFWSGGRPLYEAATYSPRQSDFLNRDISAGAERFSYLGIIAILAIPLGIIAGWRRRVVWFWLGWGVVLAIVVMGTSTPVFEWLHANTPLLSFARSVTRPLPIAAVGIALLAALAVDAGVRLVRPGRARAAAAMAAVAAVTAITAWDSTVAQYTASSASGLQAQSRLLANRPGAVISAPVFDVTNTTGVAYMYATVFDPRATANGYSPYTPTDVVRRQAPLMPLDCGIAGKQQLAAVRRYGIRNALAYTPYYGTPWAAWPPSTMIAAFDRMPGSTRIGDDGGVLAWAIEPDRLRGVRSLPRQAIADAQQAVVPCTGWDAMGDGGRFSRGGDAYLWALRRPGQPPLTVRISPGPVPNAIGVGVVDAPLRWIPLRGERAVALPVPATGRWTPVLIRPRRSWKRVPGQPENYGVQLRDPLPPLASP